jgi:elongation factor G
MISIHYRQEYPQLGVSIRGSIHAGLLTGHKMTGVRMVLQDGVSHSVDSSELAFRQAAVGAMRQAFPLAGPTVLEPVMSVEVVAPDEFQVRTP